ncbi:DUF5789 family protein [Halobellus ruber]|uniref:Uncharacterized protein n=1 Tax=Halobellus ruber TaxID=2761102 RepID=A0A7J9SFX0_9EURY|nr:DUF5789 family protein [Halobellus ruber]MBB6645840.1 hypothetical protein [Halobellus ruber]
MADDADEEADEEPPVELGEETPVEGQPLARVAARLTWPHEVSRIEAQEGDSVIRTPSGPQSISAVLDDVDETYIDSRQAFVTAVRDVIGAGPVETE